MGVVINNTKIGANIGEIPNISTNAHRSTILNIKEKPYDRYVFNKAFNQYTSFLNTYLLFQKYAFNTLTNHASAFDTK